MSLILGICKEQIFTGISEKNIDYVQELGEIPYTVTDIVQVENEDGSIEYSVHFESSVKDAPPFDVKDNSIPSNMSLRSEYTVQWLHVAAVYDNYVRDKDYIAAEFTGEIIDNAKIEKAKEQCKNVLIHDLRTLINPVFKWFSVLVIVITIICCFMLTKIAFTLAEQWVKNDEWLKLQEEFEQTMREVDSTEYYGIDTNSFDVSVTTVPVLPFRTWATEEEYLAFAEQHKLVVDLKDMTGGKGIDVDAIAAKNRRDMEAGIFPDIEVNVDAYTTTKEEFDKNEGIKPKIKKSGIAKVGSGVTKSTMPKSTLNIRRKS